MYNFTVQGEPMFPFDMLRRDQCYPATAQDVTEMIRAIPVGYDGPVTVHRIQMYSAKHPNAAKWQSYGWDVIECSKGS